MHETWYSSLTNNPPNIMFYRMFFHCKKKRCHLKNVLKKEKLLKACLSFPGCLKWPTIHYRGDWAVYENLTLLHEGEGAGSEGAVLDRLNCGFRMWFSTFEDLVHLRIPSRFTLQKIELLRWINSVFCYRRKNNYYSSLLSIFFSGWMSKKTCKL